MLKLSKQEQTAVDIYDARVREGNLDNTPLWVDGFSQVIFYDLPKDAEVLDVGCGIGRAVPILPDLGIEKYLGIDPSIEQVRVCRSRWPELQFEVSEIRELANKYPNRFSGFLLITVLMHIPRRDLSQALGSLRGCLKQGAHGMISLPMGQPDRLMMRNNVGMMLTLYTQEELESALGRHGFVVRQMFSPNSHMLLVHAEAV
jgi:SAM-dependent methyltransferase